MRAVPRGPAFALAAATLMAAAAPGTAEARRVHGAQIPDPADPVGDGEQARFIVRRSFDKTLGELRRTYGRSAGVIIRRIDTPPSVKAFYVENTRPGRTWDGINVYEVIGEEKVYISVLPARRR